MKHLRTMSACLVSLALLAGCSNDKDPDPTDPSSEISGPAPDQGPGPQPLSQYDGNYAYPCVPPTDLDPGELVELSIQGDTATLTATAFSDAECTQPGDTATQTFSLVYPGGTTDTPRGSADHVDITLESIEINGEPASAEFIQGFEQEGEFDTFYTIVLIDGASLFIGIDGEVNDGTSPELRHTEIDFDDPATRL